MSKKMKKNFPALSVKNLTKVFPVRCEDKKKKTLTAVDNISFDLNKGEILGLLGPNGAGKTTTIQMLLSILKPSEGSIEYFGKNLDSHRSEILQDVAFASTYINLPWRLTVWENLDVYARLYGLSKEQRKQRINRFLDFFKIGDQKHKPMTDLSAGQNTRVMLAKAFLAHPKVVLLDEPTASLDPDIAQEVRKFINMQRSEYEVSILFTSHNMQEVAELCDRVVVLQKGKLIASDTPDDLIAQVSHTNLKLSVGDGMKRTVKVCKAKKLNYQVDDRLIEITVEEKKIANLLNSLAKEGVDYKQISILKPTLEDYFLQVSREK